MYYRTKAEICKGILELSLWDKLQGPSVEWKQTYELSFPDSGHSNVRTEQYYKLIGSTLKKYYKTWLTPYVLDVTW